MANNDHTIFKTRGPLDPIQDHSVCVLRPELAQVVRLARASQVDAYAALLSSRQTGKTTFLYQLSAQLRSPGFGLVLIDLGSVQDQPEVQLYRFVASAIRNELAPGATEPLPSNAVEFQQFLLSVARQSPVKRIVLMLDEVEAVPAKLSDAFFGTFRSVFSTRHNEPAFEKYLVVLSGAKELSRLTGGGNSPLNIAERIYLKDLTLDGAHTLIKNFATLGIAAPTETAQWVHAQTRGHPYLTQKLCALIAEKNPVSITKDLVDKLASALLRSDDHLEKMIIEIDNDPPIRNLLGKIVSGQTMSFTRLNPHIARLELVGAIRDAEDCAIRNPIYDEALRAHFGIGGAARATNQLLGKARPLFLLAMFVLILLNAPLMIAYARDIGFATRTINDVFNPAALGIYAVIRYDNVIRANQLTTITVDIDPLASNAPLVVTLHENDSDIIIDGGSTREFPVSQHAERFKFLLNQKEIPYNPFAPATVTRKLDLIFQSKTPGKPSMTYHAEFRVDYYSAFLTSLAVSGAGIAAFFGGLWLNVQRIREIFAALARALKLNPQ
ncbi:MAG: AAA-like domain-containing protein [Chloroflexi bacterium]|nr:AAA-like domain-containing protein [Chloroflexota bacterium]